MIGHLHLYQRNKDAPIYSKVSESSTAKIQSKTPQKIETIYRL